MTTEFTLKTPSLKQIFLYTWSNLRLRNRFEFSKRDIIQTKIKIINKQVYRPTKQKAGSAPDELLQIQSFSYPQYKPYLNVKTKGAKKQRSIQHQYDVTIALQKDSNGNYSYNSKIKWRIGSYKKWVTDVPQSKVKTVLSKTREKLKKKYVNKYKEYLLEISKIRKRGQYLDIGDYNSQVNGINGDNYFRNQFLQKKFDCLYGPLWQTTPNKKEKDIQYPFACKHMISIIFFLLRKGVIQKQ